MFKKQDVFTIGNGSVKMSNNGGYMPSADACWLAEHVIKHISGKSILDAGIGTGAITLLVLAKKPKLEATGIDISKKMLDDAKLNAELNDRIIELIHDDITKWKTNHLFDTVVSNPPYFTGTARTDAAHHNVDIYEWTRSCIRRLRTRGMFYCIVSPNVVDKVVAAMYDSKCGKIELHPIETSNGIERVIISGRLGVKSPSSIYPAYRIL